MSQIENGDFIDPTLTNIANKTPKGYKRAIRGPMASEWVKSMEREMKAHNINETWTLVPPPLGPARAGDDPERFFDVMPSLWTYRIKMKNGVVSSYKSRFCADGSRSYFDKEEVFSPVARSTSLRIINALAALEGRTIRTGDVPSAYVKAPVPEGIDIYMRQPQGFEEPGKENWVCHLNKSIYGCPPSGRYWHSMFVDYITSIGFRQSASDPCLFMLNKDEQYMLIGLVVDDVEGFATDQQLEDQVWDQLKDRFDIRDDGAAEWFIGMHIGQSKEQITISQSHYCNEILTKYYLPNAPKYNTPGSGILRPADKNEPNPNYPIRAVIGSLRYLTHTRPDIEFALNQVSRHMENFDISHVLAVERILGYLLKFPDLGLKYTSDPRYINRQQSALILVAHVDSSLGDNPSNGRSSFGYSLSIFDNLVSWQAKVVPKCAISTTESEYVALSEAVKEVLHISNLLQDLGFKVHLPIRVMDDSSGAISLSKNPHINTRTKHIDLRCHFIREYVNDLTLSIEKIASCENRADIFTKDLAANLFSKFRDRMISRISVDVT